jgi:hypothetical protein
MVILTLTNIPYSNPSSFEMNSLGRNHQKQIQSDQLLNCNSPSPFDILFERKPKNPI